MKIGEFNITRRNSESLEISSPRTKGKCATAYIFGIIEGHINVVPFLHPTYMNGITTQAIKDAVEEFLEAEDEYRFS